MLAGLGLRLREGESSELEYGWERSAKENSAGA